MDVAALNAFTAGGGWTNPYVTDGLIAMWDGEWNAGGGVHDAAANVWKDLAGGCDAVVQDGVWGDTYLSLTPNVNREVIGAEVSDTLWQSAPWYVDDGPFAVEVVFDKTGANPGWVEHFIVKSKRFNVSFATSTFLYMKSKGYIGVSQDPTWTYGTGINASSGKNVIVWNFMAVPDWAHNSIWKDTVYVNGNLYDGSYNAAPSSSLSDTFRIGDFPAGNVGTAKTHRIAIYRGVDNNRSAANYAIDKARFNLP